MRASLHRVKLTYGKPIWSPQAHFKAQGHRRPNFLPLWLIRRVDFLHGSPLNFQSITVISSSSIAALNSQPTAALNRSVSHSKIDCWLMICCPKSPKLWPTAPGVVNRRGRAYSADQIDLAYLSPITIRYSFSNSQFLSYCMEDKKKWEYKICFILLFFLA